MKYGLTVLTPVYNRSEKIVGLFSSLKRQTNQKFQWLVVDDGSTDGISETIEKLRQEEVGFQINCYRKDNGGKHTAINYAHPYIDGDLVAIVDSDDELTPDAVEIILRDWNKYKHDTTVGGLTYIKEEITSDEGRKLYPYDGIIGSSFDICVNRNINGGGFEIIRTTLLKKYPFPVYPGEKYVGESYLWNSVGKEYNTVYFNKVLYKFEFQNDGLTKSGRTMRLKNPRGCMAVENSLLSGKARLGIKLKTGILFVANGLICGYSFSNIIRKCQSRIVLATLAPGTLLYLYWKSKYKFRRDS